jgi:hypothetical protein
MKFKKYKGTIKRTIREWGLECVLLLLIPFLVINYTGEDISLMSCELIFFIYCAGFSYSYLVNLCRMENGHMSDMIILDDDGIKLECKSGQDKAILWGEVSKIESEFHIWLTSSVAVTGSNGEKIRWYIANKRSERYILKQHPELRSVYSTAGKYSKS